MRISESCAECLYDKQAERTNDPEYLTRVRAMLDTRDENDTAPYMVYRFNQLHEEMFGCRSSYAEVKKQYNDLVLSMESSLREKLAEAEDPLATALAWARTGNYIDFGAMNHVDTDTFLALFQDAKLSTRDRETLKSFRCQCREARNFLLITDNCGEIVLDKLFLEQLHSEFPQLSVTAMIRGGEVLNDATEEDAEYVGLDRVASLVSTGLPLAGVVTRMLPEKSGAELARADVILAKGQGNYESMNGQGLHVFYSFLCKCDLFTGRFGVPRFTGMFVEENP